MNNHHHCKKCGKKRTNEHDVKKNIQLRDKETDHQHHDNKRKDHDKKHAVLDNCNNGAILAKTNENIVIDGKIYFNVGISNNRSFQVTDDGTEFIFTKDGFYQLTFRGKFSCIGNLIFDRNPSFEKRQRQFSEFQFDEKTEEISTMLPFHKGNRLSVRFESPKPGICILSAGGQIEIVKVDDL